VVTPQQVLAATPAIPTSPRERLLEWVGSGVHPDDLATVNRLLDAIEAAAVATERDRLRAAVEKLHEETRLHWGQSLDLNPPTSSPSWTRSHGNGLPDDG
jgi:hypothetical protein